MKERDEERAREDARAKAPNRTMHSLRESRHPFSIKTLKQNVAPNPIPSVCIQTNNKETSGAATASASDARLQQLLLLLLTSQSHAVGQDFMARTLLPELLDDSLVETLSLDQLLVGATDGVTLPLFRRLLRLQASARLSQTRDDLIELRHKLLTT